MCGVIKLVSNDVLVYNTRVNASIILLGFVTSDIRMRGPFKRSFSCGKKSKESPLPCATYNRRLHVVHFEIEEGQPT